MAFQSTLPIQGETKYLSLSVYCNSISIHSPYTGRDNLEIFRQLKQWHFNPLSLYRERQWLSIRRTQKWTFQSTLPIQGETGIVHNPNRLEKFQSTLPIQGETHRIIAYCYSRIFQSTLPIQGETVMNHIYYPKNWISIHSPYTGRDPAEATVREIRDAISIHSPYTGRDMWDNRGMTVDRAFQSTLPIQGETAPLCV